MFSDVIALFEHSPAFFYTTLIILGLVIGSFLNVVIFRLPKMLEQEWFCECRELLVDELKTDNLKADTLGTEQPLVDQQFNNSQKSTEQVIKDSAIDTQQDIITLSKPASTCPNCGHKITLLENIPVLSWLILKGKCSACKNPISARYPIIEIVTAVASLAIGMHFGVSWQTVFMLGLTWSLITLTMIDFDKMILPDQITLPLVWIGLLLGLNDVFVSLDQAVIGAMVGYMSLWSIFWLFKLITGKEGMGYGDFKLFAVFGAWFGWQTLPLLILMASLVGAIVGICLMAFKNHEGSKPIPFGPYLAVAGWITALWGEGIWAWYMGMIV